MDKHDLIKKKRRDILGALNLAIIMLEDQTDENEIIRKINDLIRILQDDVKAFEHIDDYLELRKMFETDD